MALPTLVRTWRFKVAQVSAGSSTIETQTDTLMLLLVASLLATGAWTDKENAPAVVTPVWTVKSSNSGAGVFGNNDNVNRWSTIADIVHAAAGSNHSWMVLGNTLTGVQLLIDFNSSSNTNITIIVSHSGFGVANGGADGTATAAPTALNSITLCSAAGTWGVTSTASTQTIVQAMFSTDGLDTRIVFNRNGVMCGLWHFGKAEQAIGTWTNPYFAIVQGDSTAAPVVSTPTAAQLASQAALYRGFGSASFVMGLTTEGFSDGALFQTLTGSDGFLNTNPMLPTRLASVTASHTGSRGLVADSWLGRSNIATGTGYPAAGPAEFMQFGSRIDPWNKSIVVVS